MDLSVPQDPVSLVVIGSVTTAIATIIGDYLVRRHFRFQDRKMKHSSEINLVAIVPWSTTQLSHNDIWNSDRFGEPQLTVVPEESVEPHYRWAIDHLKTTKPQLVAAWSAVNAAIRSEKDASRAAKHTILQQFAKQVAAEFKAPLRALPKLDEAQRDVYFEDLVVHTVYAE